MSKVLIGYVKKWNYLQEDIKTRLAGEPKEGSIYRIIYEDKAPTSDSLYQIYIGKDTNPAKMDTVFLGADLKGAYYDRWEFEIELINKDNYLEFEYRPDELPLLKKWLDSNNSDLIDLMTKSPVPVDISQEQLAEPSIETDNTVSRALKEVISREIEYDKSMHKLQRGLNIIMERDLDIAVVLSELIHYIATTYKDKYEDAGNGNMSRDFLISTPTPHATCFNALKYIQRYTTTGFAKSGKIVDVHKAIHYLLFELQRSKQQKTNDKN